MRDVMYNRSRGKRTPVQHPVLVPNVVNRTKQRSKGSKTFGLLSLIANHESFSLNLLTNLIAIHIISYYPNAFQIRLKPVSLNLEARIYAAES